MADNLAKLSEAYDSENVLPTPALPPGLSRTPPGLSQTSSGRTAPPPGLSRTPLHENGGPETGDFLFQDPSGQYHVDFDNFGARVEQPTWHRDLTEMLTFDAVSGRALSSVEDTMLKTVSTGVLKGLRDLAVGVSTFALETVGLEDAAETVSKTVPQVKTNIGGALVGAVTQFALPGGAAFKRAAAIRKAYKSRKSVQRAAGGLAAALTDIIAVDPRSQPPIFDPGAPEGRRIVTGVESGAITGVAMPILGLARKVGLEVYHWAKSLLATEQQAQKFARDAIRNAVLDPEGAIKKIDESLRVFEGSDIQPGAGVASGDQGLIGLEKAVGAQSDTSAIVAQRAVENQTAAARELEGALPRPGQAGAAGEFFRTTDDATLAGPRQAQKEAEARLAEARVELENELAIMDVARQAETPASQRISTVVQDEIVQLTATKNKLHDAIDPPVLVDGKRTKTTPLAEGTDDLLDVLDKVFTPSSRGDFTPARLPAIAVKIKRLVEGEPTDIARAKAERVSRVETTGPSVTFGELMDTRAELSSAIKAARLAGDGAVIERLVILKNGIEAEVGKLANTGTAAGQRAREAKQFFSEVFAPKVREGVGGTVARANRRGSPVQPSMVGGKFLRPGTKGALEAAEDLRRIIDDAPTRTEALGDVREFVVAKFAGLLSGKSNAAMLARVREFSNTYQDALKSFPEVATEIKEIQLRLSKRLNKITNLEADAKRLREAAGLTEKELQRAATNVFIHADPVKAVKYVFNAQNPVLEMRQLVAAAAKDSTGEATKGLKTAVSEALDEMLTSTTSGASGDLLVRATAVEGLFKRTRVVKALEAVYTPLELRTLQKYRDRLRIMDRISTPVKVGAPTAELTEATRKADVVGAALFGIVRGRGISEITKRVRSFLGLDPLPRAEMILTEALLDPPLARTMLLPTTETGLKKAKRAINTHFANNFLAVLTDEATYDRDTATQNGIR